MVSGIGPRQHLEDHGIEVLVDLPGVGQNMWDHPFVGPSYRVNVETVTKIANNLTYLASQYLQWATKQLGPFTNPVSDLLAWKKIPYELRRHFSSETLQALSQFPDDWPEVEVRYYLSDEAVTNNVCSTYRRQGSSGISRTYKQISLMMGTSMLRSSASSLRRLRVAPLPWGLPTRLTFRL
jgi:choline dehydrogenase-like flavoprotein